MKVIAERPHLTHLLIAGFLAAGLASAAILPVPAGILVAAGCACAAFLAYGRRVYLECLDGQDLF